MEIVASRMLFLAMQTYFVQGNKYSDADVVKTLKYLIDKIIVEFDGRIISIPTIPTAGLRGSVGCASDWRPGGRGFNPRLGRQHSFVESDHEIFSTVILSLPLIQEGQLSVTGERMCTTLVNRIED